MIGIDPPHRVSIAGIRGFGDARMSRLSRLRPTIPVTYSLSPVLRGEGGGEGRSVLKQRAAIASITASKLFSTSSSLKRTTLTPRCDTTFVSHRSRAAHHASRHPPQSPAL